MDNSTSFKQELLILTFKKIFKSFTFYFVISFTI